MKENVMSSFVMPILVLTVICLVVSSALAFMNNATKPVIAEAAASRTEVAMISKIPEATGFELIDTKSYDGLPATIRAVYRTTNDVGYVIIAAANGFSGDITIMCAFEPGGDIISVSTLSHTETKGIGTIIEQPSFLDTFKGKDSGLEGVDTVTGATISTRAFIRAINDMLAAFEIIGR